MNTTARLEQVTRDLDRRFLVSTDSLSRHSAIDRYALEPLGPQALRGRAAPVEVYAVGTTHVSTIQGGGP
jgi:class 3 adenylate cyclase